jgi:hypothetical protein
MTHMTHFPICPYTRIQDRKPVPYLEEQVRHMRHCVIGASVLHAMVRAWPFLGQVQQQYRSARGRAAAKPKPTRVRA